MKTIATVAVLLCILLGAGLLYLFAAPASGKPSLIPIAPGGPRFTEIVNPSGFVNTEPITVSQFVGKKVILIDFLTYSCINCQRTFPYVNAWDKEYSDKGLIIIGIHTPEFAFEKDIKNVTEAMKKFGITHPIVLDNDYSTWNAYGNQYWPRRYLIDIHGNVVYDHAGEGAYQETEMKIKELLKERAAVLGETLNTENNSLTVSSIPVATTDAGSPETYFGASRNEYLGNGLSGQTGEQNFPQHRTLDLNTLYLVGVWNVRPEYAETSPSVDGEHPNRIDYLYHSKSVYFVAGSAKSADIEVLVDNKPVPQSMKGSDIFYKNGKSFVTISGNKLYRLVEGAEKEQHELILIISSPGLQAFTFTFG